MIIIKRMNICKVCQLMKVLRFAMCNVLLKMRNEWLRVILGVSMLRVVEVWLFSLLKGNYVSSLLASAWEKS